MKSQSSTSPIILGSLLILLSIFSLGAVSLMAFNGDKDEDAQQSKIPNPDRAFGQIEQETEQLIVPIQPNRGSGGDATASPQVGIRTGTYSNPPTHITSSSYSSSSRTSRPPSFANSSSHNNFSSSSLNLSNPGVSNFSSSSPSTSSSSNSTLNSSSVDIGISSSTTSSFDPASNRSSSSNNNLGF